MSSAARLHIILPREALATANPTTRHKPVRAFQTRACAGEYRLTRGMPARSAASLKPFGYTACSVTPWWLPFQLEQ
jgi:hypothetical protein